MARNVFGEKLPVRIKASDVQVTTEIWQLPEVGRHSGVGLHAKTTDTPDPVSVVEEEIVAEKVTLAELESIREQAREEGFEEGKKAGYDAGFQQGQEAGQTQGLSDGQQRIDAQIQRVQALLATLDTPLQAQEALLATLVTEMAIEVAQAVVGHQISSEPQTIQLAISEAVAALPEASGQLMVYVASEDYEIAQRFAEQQPTRVTVAADASIAAGGCKVVTDTSVVDYCIEQRFANVVGQVRQRLQGALHNPAQGTQDETSSQPE